MAAGFKVLTVHAVSPTLALNRTVIHVTSQSQLSSKAGKLHAALPPNIEKPTKVIEGV